MAGVDRTQLIFNINILIDVYVYVYIAPTPSEISARRGQRETVRPSLRNDAAVAILSKSTHDSDAKATLACVLPW